MTRKYQVTSQLDGLPREAPSFDEIKAVREQLIRDYIEHGVLFQITVLTQDEDGFWVQAAADDNGEPVVVPQPHADDFGLDEGTQP